MHKLGAFLVLLCLILGFNHGKKEEPREEEIEKVPMDFLVFTGGDDMETMFGFNIIEYLHAERMRCDIKNRKAELKFTDQLDHMMKYFRQAKETMSQPEFEELASENKRALNRNFQKAFRDLEVNHYKKLSRMHENCDLVLEKFMEDRMRRVIWYANSLLHSDMEKFLKFSHDMTEFQNNLQFGLSECIVYMEKNSVEEHFEEAGPFFDLCYGNEVVLLLRFLRNFTTMSQDIMHRMLNPKPTDKIVIIDPTEVPEGPPSDLEDGDVDEEGFGSGEEPEVETTTPMVETAVYEYEMDSTAPEEWTEEWTTGKPTEMTTKKEKPKATTEKAKPTEVTTQKTKPTEKEKVTAKPSDGKETTTTESSKPISKEDLLKKFGGALEPGPVILDETGKPVTIPKPMDLTTTNEPNKKPLSTTAEYPDWADEMYKKIGGLAEKPKEQEKSKTENTKEVDDMPEPDKSPQQSKSHSKEEDTTPGLSIELDLPGVDAGVNVQIGPNGVQIDAQGGLENEIVFEEEVTTTEEPTSHGHNFKTMFFIYFFATLGTLLAITLIILIVLIVTLKLRQKSISTAKDHPLLSEEEKIAVMKQSGYVNPTYQFFDQVKDV